jgi:bacterioferritin-associated ferredoxin
MLVCHCFAVREREIRSEIARGAESTCEIARRCRAGAGCGGCVPLIEELLAEQNAQRCALAIGRANECAVGA